MFPDELDKKIQEGLILALVNYLPYNKDTSVGFISDSEYLDLGTKASGKKNGDGFSLDVVNIKQMSQPILSSHSWLAAAIQDSVNLFLYMFSKLIVLTSDDEKVTTTMAEPPILSVLPSSTKDNPHHGMSTFCEILAPKIGLSFSKEALIRTRDISKATDGGPRDEKIHEDSLAVGADVRGKSVLLLDDVTTSGASRKAAIAKLQAAGAKVVYFLAIGLTLKQADFREAGGPRTIISQHWTLFFPLIIEPLPTTKKNEVSRKALANKAFLFFKPAEAIGTAQKVTLSALLARETTQSQVATVTDSGGGGGGSSDAVVEAPASVDAAAPTESLEPENSTKHSKTELKVQNNKLKALQILLSKRETSGEKRVTLTKSLEETLSAIAEIEATLKTHEAGGSSADPASAVKKSRM